ncbi:diguanylate cyclase domain-containing protein [Acidovorax sp. A1169]|uniref:diguanylate cyclase domain-containing protein n=1 Tax=Acidovorax sp. A1169 TaxID=3059524 RepID=UPI00273783B3|nr:diguanylate cyclase [Acidovorax sp. A1169]MDP4078545.1 diguanylate cyclase [Acidovorax sp. A1169]
MIFDAAKRPTRQEFSSQRLEPWKVFWFVFALAGLAIGVQLLNVRHATREAESARLLDISRYVSENLTRQLDGLNKTLTNIKRDYRDSVFSASSADSSRQLHLLTDAIQAVSGLAVYDANGTAVASDRDSDVGKDFFSQEFFTAVRRRPDPNVLYLSRPSASDDERVALHLSRAIFNTSGQFTGVVSATLDEEFFAFTVRSALFAPDMRATLVHPDGAIFVTVPKIEGRRPVNVATPGSAFVDHVVNKRKRTVFEGLVAVTGRERLLVLTSVQSPELGLDNTIVFAVSREKSAVYAPWYHQVRIYVSLYLAVLLMATALRLFERRRRRKLLQQEEVAQAALRLSASRLERALDGAQLGLWELHVDSRQLQLDARGARMLGYEESNMVRSTQEWTQTLHQDDQAVNIAAFAAHLKGDTPVYENEFRVEVKDGGYVWLFSRGKVTERAQTGAPLRVIGTFMDVSARKANEAALAEATLLQKLSGEIAQIGGWAVEVPSGVSRWTEEVYRIHDLDPVDAPDLSNALDFYTEEFKPVISAAIAKGMQDGTPWDLELQIVSAKGRLVWVRAQGAAICQGGTIVRLAGALQDITSRKQAALELQRLNAALSELSYQDALTGVGNRRLFDEALSAEWGRNARRGSMLALLMIDVDYFKRFNDHHGHLGGDECLRQVANVLRDTLRRSHERAMRYGGEEFAILLPETSVEGASLVALRILSAMAAAQIPHGASPVSPWVTLSIGVAGVMPTVDAKPSMLTRFADMALYQAKAQGRARLATYEDVEQK